MKKKLNVKKIALFVVIILVIVVGLSVYISNLIKESNYHKTYEYKLLQIGYSENEVKVILEELKDEEINDILNLKYDLNLTKFLKSKYFMFKNLNRYLNYMAENEEATIDKTVAIVNVGADSDWYSNIVNTDISLNSLMLVNKFYKLDESYVPSDLMELPGYYALNGIKASASIYDDLERMLDAARDAGFTLVVSQGYRSYLDQKEAYEDIEDTDGTRYADKVAARAGHSEYQSGLGVVITPYGTVIEDDENSEQYKWLINNAYKYGFILRYEKGKEDITGFEADPWRYRYVGVDAAKTIKNENITFDEYYAYYLDKNIDNETKVEEETNE